MTDREKELRDLLIIACGLIEIESRDHKDHHKILNEQRDRIAATLDAFCLKARAAISGEAPEEADL